MHACLNCRFHEAGAYNQCRENRAERQVEKERENRCEYFEAALKLEKEGRTEERARGKQAFDALFGKLPSGEAP